MFFFFFFSSLFCPVLQRPLFPTCRVLKPPPLHRASPLKPRKSRRRHCLIHGHASKDMFFSFLFFRSFSDQCYRDPLYPTRQVLKPPPLHPIIPSPISPPSSLASPRRHRHRLPHASRDLRLPPSPRASPLPPPCHGVQDSP